jgi:hypothetical protein
MTHSIIITEMTQATASISILLYFLCPVAVYYLRYAVRSFFTISCISLADSNGNGIETKSDRKIYRFNFI